MSITGTIKTNPKSMKLGLKILSFCSLIIVMIYLFIKINSRKQIEKINPDLMLSVGQYIEEEIHREGGTKLSGAEDEDFCYGLPTDRGGKNKGRETVIMRVMRACFSVSSFLAKKEEELFGYNIIIAKNEELAQRDICEALRSKTTKLEDENSVWLDNSLCSLASELIILNEEEYNSNLGLWKVEKLYTDRAKGKEYEKNKGLSAYKRDFRWLREKDIEKVLDALTPRLNKQDRSVIPYVFGYKGVGKTEIVYEAVKRILGRQNEKPWIHLFSIFKSTSPIHPFINSVRGDVLNSIHDHLLMSEKTIFKELEPLFKSIISSGDASVETTNDAFKKKVIPDHITEDFFLAYHFYILSFVRMMNRQNLPAVFVCDDIELYNPKSRQYILTLVNEFSKYDVFIPLFVSSEKVIPEDLDIPELKKVYISPLSSRALKEFSVSLDEKLILSEKLLRKVRRITKGLYIPVLHYLLYLKDLKESRSDMPSNVKICSLYLLDKLDLDLKKLLYCIYVSKSILRYKEQIEFIVSLGYAEQNAVKMIEELSMLGFIAGRKYLSPGLNGLQKALEDSLGRTCKEIQEEFIEYIKARWEKGEYNNYVLLFYFFLKTEEFNLAEKVYHAVVQRKLNERDLAGIDNFLQESRWKDFFSKDFTAYMILYRILKVQLSGNIEMAYKIYSENRERITAISSGIVIAGLNISVKRIEEALEKSKHALMEYQSLKIPESIRASYIKLGEVMLARSKLEDALEYFLLADKINIAKPMLDSVYTVILAGITRYIQGDLSDALMYCERGTAMAGELYSREWEVFNLFFKARLLFEAGAYGKCIVLLEKLLSMLSLYKIENGERVIYSWLARSFIYNGSYTVGLRILEHLGRSFLNAVFSAEGYYRLGDYKKAVRAIEEANSTVWDRASAEYRFLPGERILWQDGYYHIEGRCLGLADSMLKRYSDSLLWFLYFLTGRKKKALDGFEDMLKTKIQEFDPHLHYYYYLYSECLEGERFTMLNRAWKVLQERVNKVSSPEVKREYRERNYWNKQIYERAQSYKLT